MKRFLADAALVLILVAIGSYIKNSDSQTTQFSVQQKVESFEDSIASHHEVKKQIEASGLNEIKENKASELAKASSEFIIDGIHTSVAAVSDIFDSIFK